MEREEEDINLQKRWKPAAEREIGESRSPSKE